MIASVIVVGYNGKRYLDGCLAAILDQDIPPERYEVFFVDNHSTDQSAEWVETRFPVVRTIRFARNLGFYVACNTVAAMGTGRHIVVVPQDTVVHRRWLSELVRAAEEDPRAMVCTTNHLDPGSPGYAGRDRVNLPSCIRPPRMSKFGVVCNPEAEPFAAQPKWTVVCSGVSLLVKRAFLREASPLFEPLVGHYAGDLEFGLRVSTLGYKVLFVPAAVIYHVGEEAKSLVNAGLLFRYVMGSRDRILAYYKNMTTAEFLLFLPLVTLGLSLNAFELRASLAARVLLFGVALAGSPVVLLMAVARFPRFAPAKQEMRQRRRVGRLWLLRQVWHNGNVVGSSAEDGHPANQGEEPP